MSVRGTANLRDLFLNSNLLNTTSIMPAADVYGLTRDAKESERLNTQHVVWKTNIGVLLHPKVVAGIPSDAHIGDVGTGTGIWIDDLAKEQQGSRYT